MSAQETREAVQSRLAALAKGDVGVGARVLLNALGYESERSRVVESVDALLSFSSHELTEKQRDSLRDWKTVEIVFQITGEEISAAARGPGLPLGSESFDGEVASSFVFLAVDLARDSHTRSELANMTRVVNRLFSMPVLVLFRHGEFLTLAVVHRRRHRRDGRDVLEKVTLIKDVRLGNPHRAHIDILTELALPQLVAKHDVSNFDGLHVAWEKTLDIEALNDRFYDELFTWYDWAREECRFPDGEKENRREQQVIRMITRLLFVWFMREKGLIPPKLFDKRTASALLKKHDPADTGYYCAVLQNLFFATLNTPIDKRRFSSKSQQTHRDSSLYRYRKLLKKADDFLEQMKEIPFVNGGLFDCLDSFEAAGKGGVRVDCFTDNNFPDDKPPCKDLVVPGRLFFGDDEHHGLFQIFNAYKFTVQENTPVDEEVALDPELLGLTFENLLATYNPETRDTARHATGSYYTPRRIVDYMVDEALLAWLLQKVTPEDGDHVFLEERLRDLLAWDQREHAFEDGEIRQIVDAIDGLKILDPAVGSGAFPMGILHKLTLVLDKVDPDNRLWKKKQLAAVDRIDDPKARDEARNATERAFSPENSHNDYGRKLYLIQSAVHGVDIQPIAVQIAKLRFFISLVIEQKAGEDAADNYGIQPLPNLETRFVAANALLGISKQKGLVSEEVRALEEGIERIRRDYFDARTRDKKITCMKRDKKAREELSAALKKDGFPEGDANRIAAWDPYNQNAPAAQWFDPEWMFGVTEGFDIAIGNPPYIRGEKTLGKVALKATYGKFFKATADIYTYFYHRGAEVLKDGGVLCFITSNKFMRAGYGKELRRFLTSVVKPLRLLDFGRTGLFEATVRPLVGLFRKGGTQEMTTVATASDRAHVEDPATLVEKHGFPMPVSALKEDGWAFGDSERLALRDKIKATGDPLEKHIKGKIYSGIKTGLNEAFVISSETRDRLIAEDQKSKELIHPWLRGRDVRRWRVEWAEEYLITIPSSANHSWPWSRQYEITAEDTFEATYPAIAKHIFQWRSELKRRRDKGEYFWELRSCAYYAVFEKTKVIYPDIGKRMRACFDTRSYFVDMTAFSIPGNKYLLAVLNSKIMDFYYRVTLQNLDDPHKGGDLRFKTISMKILPIAKVDAKTRKQLEGLVDKTLSAEKAGSSAEVERLEREMDALIYPLYALTPAEIALIESATANTA